MSAATPTLADFTAWAEAQKAQALEDMRVTTGDAFGKSCDWFIALLATTKALERFEDVLAEAAKEGGAA